MNKDELFSQLMPNISALFDRDDNVELLTNPFVKDSKEMFYKVINLVNEPQVKFSIEDNHLIILIEGSEGKMFRVKIDDAGIAKIQNLLHEKPKNGTDKQ